MPRVRPLLTSSSNRTVAGKIDNGVRNFRTLMPLGPRCFFWCVWPSWQFGVAVVVARLLLSVLTPKQ
jgi:hypothetical protein